MASADSRYNWCGGGQLMAWRVRRWCCSPVVRRTDAAQAGAPGKVPAQATAPAVAAAADASAARPHADHRHRPCEDCRQGLQGAATHQSASSRRYRSGVDNYRAGHLDAARADFDSAVDLMLTSGMDLKSDPQLSDEFEHLLNAVNSLEMAALKQGNGFSPAIEAAPLDAANEVTFPPNAALTAQGHGRAEDDAVRLSAGGERLCRWLHQLLLELARRAMRICCARWSAPASTRT